MRVAITRRWWVLALRGVLGILVGIAAFAWPETSLPPLAVLVGGYVLVDGALALVTGTLGRSWLLALEGLVGLAAGGMTLRWGATSELVLLFLVAAWALATGLVELAAATPLRRLIHHEVLMATCGMASILLALTLVIQPQTGVLTVVWLVGAYALTSGPLLLGLAYRLRRRRPAVGSRSVSPIAGVR